MDPRSSAEWKCVWEAVAEGDDADDGLNVKHLESAREIEVLEDGRIRFRVERHPHLFGRPSRGMRSSAFIRERRHYEFDPNQGLTCIDREQLGVEIDADTLIEEEVRLAMEGLSLERECADLLRCETREAAEGVAKKYAKGYAWLLELDIEPQILEEQRAELRASCAVAFAEELITLWEDRVEPDDD